MRSYVPQYLHKPSKIMMLDADEFLVLGGGIFLGVVLKSVIIAGAMIAFFIYYRKGKDKHLRGYFKHLPHMLGFKEFKYFPNIFIRSFQE